MGSRGTDVRTEPNGRTAMSTTTTTHAALRAAVASDVDMYKNVHKGIRAELFGTTLQAGNTDPSARPAAVALAERFDALVDMLGAHAAHEDDFVQPSIERFAPEAAAVVATDHPAFEDRLVELRTQAWTAVDTPAD